MKKKIMELVKANEGTYRLNNICFLTRYTKSAIGENVDVLNLCFDNINGVNFGAWVVIKARDYDGIIEECNKAIEDYLNAVALRLTTNLKAGYRNVTREGV